MNIIEFGDCRETMRRWAAQGMKAQTCVTSPPYFGLRDYGHDGQIGLEPTPDAYIAKLVEVFHEVRRVLRDDGTLWLNIGDSYAANRGYQVPDGKVGDVGNSKGSKVPDGLKVKDLIGIPWMLAFALRADGWYLRQDIIWHKPNPMPESVQDRCTKAHEYIFLLSKSQK
jgi:DNA modification methylase